MQNTITFYSNKNAVLILPEVLQAKRRLYFMLPDFKLEDIQTLKHNNKTKHTKDL